MKKRVISLIAAVFLLMTVFAVPSFAAGESGYTWSAWSTTVPSNTSDYETKTQYSYRDKQYVYNGYQSYSGYTKASTSLVSTSYSDWYVKARTPSDKEGATYRTIVTDESKSVNYSYAYVCKCKKWYWKNDGGKHSSSCGYTKNLLKIYSSKSVSSAGFTYDSSDKSYAAPKKVGTSSPGKFGTIYLTTYNGNRTSYFTSGISNTWLWSGSKKTIHRAVTKKYQYKHWKWGSWSSYSDSYVSSTSDREVKTRKLYRYKIYNQTINGASSFNKTYGDSSFSLNATAKTALSYSSSDTSIATVSSSGVVTIKKAGTVTINVKAAASSSYNSASKQVTINISKANPNLKYSGASEINKRYGNKDFSIEATAKPGVRYSSSDTSVATISSAGVVTIKKAGTTTISIKSAKPECYYTEEKTVELNVAKANQQISCDVKSSVNKSFGSSAFSLGAKSKTKKTYTTSDSNIATVSSEGKVTLKNPGKAVITITANEGTNYKKATRKITVNVSLKKPSLTVKTKTTNGKRKATLTWTKPYGAQGYELYAYVPSSETGKTTYIKSGDKKSATVSGFKKKTMYKYKIRAYRMVDGQKVYSSYTSYEKVYFSK